MGRAIVHLCVHPGCLGMVIKSPELIMLRFRRLLDDRSTAVYYTWSLHAPSSSVTSSITHTDFLTTYQPPQSTYKPVHIPIPPEAKSNDIWKLRLFVLDNEEATALPPSSSDKTHTLASRIPLTSGKIIDVWSEGIRFWESGSATLHKPVKTISKKEKEKGRERKGKKHDNLKNSASGPTDPVLMGQKQTRIVRTWAIPPRTSSPESISKSGPSKPTSTPSQVGIPSNTRLLDDPVSSSTQPVPGQERTDARITELSAATAIKRDAEGLPKRPTPCRLDVQHENGNEEEEVSQRIHDVVEEQRCLSVIEETSFDLDKVSDQGVWITLYVCQ
jgi:hypothetical protein